MTDKRLLACAEYVSGVGIAVDVGTDHGYLPCYLAESGKCKRVIAADVNTGPLKSAQENIKNAHLTDRITTVLSDGLDNISPDGVSDVVIAGMGGELIADIVGRARGFYSARFILQPMSKAELLRKWLWDNGFDIVSEKVCFESFYYTVMLVRFTGSSRPYSDDEIYRGAVLAKTEDEIGYILKQVERLRVKGNGMLRGGTDTQQAQRYLSIADKLQSFAEDKGGKAL